VAGALVASQKAPDIAAFPVLGHHGGLPNRACLKRELKAAGSDRAVTEAARTIGTEISAVRGLPDFLRTGSEKQQRRACEFFVRMLFSCLVDADFLDTERYMEPQQAEVRGIDIGLQDLHTKFQQYQQGFDADTPLNAARGRIFDSVMESAGTEPGFFSLSIPTGGGKTNTGMGFALAHALQHDMQRIVVVIPYTSIIKQTADVYRDMFGADSVVEHHSSVDPHKESDWNRLAAENWDAPIIVTTSVQFFDSLHSNKPSRCRKLHNIARSVVVLDEVQTLPPGLLNPILNGMRELVEHYGVSFVFSTATQPAFTDRPGFSGLTGVRELAPDAHGIFEDFQRVSYRLPDRGETVPWEDLADRIAAHEQALAIVNTKKDAGRLYQLLADQTTFHLSSSMCPSHREAVLEVVTKRLDASLPCRLISTQVVEAGVDIDFPVLYRAFGPLDSIVQAAGRCNREGKLDCGRAIVFRPEEGGMPPGAYRTATDLTEILVPDLQPTDMYSPELFQDYFARLYNVQNLDEKDILEKRADLDFPETAARFHLINSDTHPVIVPWEEGTALADEMRHKEYMSRRDFRRIQNYAVMLWSYRLEQALQDGLCAQVRPGLYEWLGRYDEKLGVVMDPYEPQDLIC
jgi:CRISPR-associated endonuclease/helicase Cas3